MQELDAFYAKEYRYDAHLLIAGEKRWRARRILDLAMPSRTARVLDIGCMYGYLLEEARARGAHAAVGVELSAGPARAAGERGLNVFCGTIEAFAAQSKHAPFDLVVAQHVLEHVPDPAAFLEQARKLLGPIGVLCICVPNYDARARRVFREAWGWYQVPVHLHHFNARGLVNLLDRAGFEPVRTERRGGDSLFVMLTLLQSIGKMPKSDEAQAPGAIGRAVVRTASVLLRPYYAIGDDELLIIARPKRSPTT
jgi:SAM-dependent methyltransferase